MDQDPATIMTAIPGVMEAYENTLSKTVATGASGAGYFAGTRFTSDMSTKRTSYGGFDAFFFKGIPIVEDVNAPASHLFMLNLLGTLVVN